MLRLLSLIAPIGRIGRPLAVLLALALLALAGWSTLTNPFAPWGLVQTPQRARTAASGIALEPAFALEIDAGPVVGGLAKAKAGFHIAAGALRGQPSAAGDELDEILDEIDRLRFDPDDPYIITGDHFSVFYPRNLGVFYLPAVDPRIAPDDASWERRQRAYLQSAAYAVEAFTAHGRPTTTLVPTGARSVAPVDIYHYPSDALYGTLYALRALQTDEDLRRTYPFPAPGAQDGQEERGLETAAASRRLVAENRAALAALLDDYLTTVLDPDSGLVRADLKLSSAKDITLRQSAFYDNVIAWRTIQLADQLGIAPADPEAQAAFKQRILRAFWLQDEGYFLEDLSPEGRAGAYYSSDWLVAFFSGFLDPADPAERAYLERSVAHVQAAALDQPFGLRYHHEDRASRQVPLVRLVVPEYGGSAIWSFWGMEYAKLLLRLHHETGRGDYLEAAEAQLAAYRHNIVRDRGFPEVYDGGGAMLERALYKSVRRSGWMVNFEQAEAMAAAARAAPGVAERR